MRRRLVGFISAAALLLAGGITAQQTRQAEIDLQSAIRTETVTGDLKAAIKQYENIISKYSRDRALVADALVHMAECYQKLGDSESRRIYERILREFSDQKDAVAIARAHIVTGSPAARAVRQIWTTRPGEDPDYNSPSPDGRYIAFTDWQTGDLCVRDLSANSSRCLTNSGGLGDYGQNSVFSQDGRQIAYSWVSNKDLRNEVRVVSLAGGNPRTVWRSETAADFLLPQGWTPDGKTLLVVRIPRDGTRQLALLSMQDGAVRVLKSFSWQYLNASLSPDGRLIAFSTLADPEKPGKGDIFIMAVDGSREVTAVRDPADDAGPVWSPDGSQILFLSDRTGQYSLWAVPVVNGNADAAQLVRADVGRVDTIWMTRSGALYYLLPGTASPNIYTADLSADMKVSNPRLAVDKFVNSNNGPSVSPDGQYLVYEQFRGGADPAIMVRNLKTGEDRAVPAQIPVQMIRGIGPFWFPDGRSLLVMSRVPQGPGSNFYRVDVADGHAELLLRTSSRVQSYKLSPDGKNIYYAQLNADDLKGRLVKFDIESRHESELTQAAIYCVAVSPDGKQLAYLASVGSESYLAVMSASGGEAREVFRDSPWKDGARYNGLVWSPDQKHLLFVRGGEGNTPNILWKIPVSGGRAEQTGLSRLGRIASPQIHPDGKRIFFAANDNAPNEVWALENFLPALKAQN